MESGAPHREAVSDLARDILGYLRSHGDARDSLEGIVEWWMLERDILRETGRVKSALEELVRKGLVEVVRSPGRSQFRATRPGR
jgi:hypothetical protein